MIDDPTRLAGGVSPSPAVLARARAAALRELAQQGPAVPWRRQARQLAATVAVVTATGVAVVAALNWPPAVLVTGRLPAVVVLGVAQIVGLLAAVAPGRSRLGPLSWALAAAGALLVLANRGTPGAPAARPEWVCSLSHVAVGLVPLALVIRRLRDVAFDWRRAFTAGLALGVSAPLWGEVACERDRHHAIVHHLGALALLALACLVIARLDRRRSYAP